MRGLWLGSVRTVSIFGALLAAGVGCKSTTPEDGSEAVFAQGFGGFSHGHEKLTQIAVMLANDALEADNPTPQRPQPTGLARYAPWNWGSDAAVRFFSEDQLGDPAAFNTNPLTWGSFASDFPVVTRNLPITTFMANKNRSNAGDKITLLNFIYCQHFGLAPDPANFESLRPRLKECDMMPFDGKTQDIHFLRDWTDTTPPKLTTGRETCKLSQDRVRKATIEAIARWHSRMSDPENKVDGERYPHFPSYFFLGMALHTIQDAFSGAHVDRDPENPHRINRICHYNEYIAQHNIHPEICRHGTPFDKRDLIWRANIAGYTPVGRFITGAVTKAYNRFKGDYENLTDEGQGAVLASGAYLTHVARFLQNRPKGPSGEIRLGTREEIATQIEPVLQSFFNDAVEGPAEAETDLAKSGSGYINCDKITEQG